MLKRIAFTLVFCCMAVSAFAAPKDFGEFSLDLADGWALIGEPINQQGVLVAMFMNEAAESMVNVTLAPTQGQSAKELGDLTSEGMKAQGAVLKIVKTSDDKVVFEGKQDDVEARMVLSTDTGAKVMSTVVSAGDLAACGKLVKTIKFKNSKLSAE